MHLGKNVFESKVRERSLDFWRIRGIVVYILPFFQDLARKKKEKG